MRARSTFGVSEPWMAATRFAISSSWPRLPGGLVSSSWRARARSIHCGSTGWIRSSVAFRRVMSGFQQLCGAGGIVRVPAVEMDELSEALACLPACGLERRRRRKLGHVADAQVGDRDNVLRDAEQLTEPVEIQNTHPADAERFGASRQPEVLDRADGGIEIGGRIGDAAELGAFGTLAVARDAQVDRRFQDALKFQAVVERAPLARVTFGGLPVSFQEAVADAAAQRFIADNDEVPGLHEPDRRSVMRRV